MSNLTLRAVGRQDPMSTGSVELRRVHGVPHRPVFVGDQVNKDAEPRVWSDGGGEGGGQGECLAEVSSQHDELLNWAAANPLPVFEEELDSHELSVRRATSIYQAVHFVLGEEAGVVGVSD